MNPIIRKLSAPATVAASVLLQGCAAVPLLIQAAASNPEGTKQLMKDAKDALTPTTAAPAAAAANAPTSAPVVPKAGIVAVGSCPVPATAAANTAPAATLSPAARAAAAKNAVRRDNGTVAQASQMLNLAKDGAAAAKDAAGAIDGSCVTVTVGQSMTRKDGTVVLVDNKPKSVSSFNLVAPNCTAGNVAGTAWANLKGLVSGDAKAEAEARQAACANDKATIQAELAAAGAKASTAYRVQYKLPVTSRVSYTVGSHTIDLSSALQNAATGAVMPQIQQGIQGAGANAVGGIVHELTRK